jgi:rod shape-determining protein MreC
MIILPLNMRTTISRIGTLSLVYPFSELDQYLHRIDTTFKINKELNRKLDSLTVQVSMLIENKCENERLRTMLDFKTYIPFTLVPAEVVSMSPGAPHKTMVISVGTEKNVTANMPVISPQGVVGKTIATGWRSSTVQLLYDPACRVAARDQATRVNGIITYSGGRFLSLSDVPVEEVAAEGDSVVTSGLGGIFPEGLFIGTIIASEEKEGGLFRGILVAPGANLPTLDEVFVITSPVTR